MGKFLESKYEGADLIKEIKLKYPEKYISAYTADKYTPTFQKYLKCANNTVEKGLLDVDSWSSLLEGALKTQADTKVNLFNKIRLNERLIRNNLNFY